MSQVRVLNQDDLPQVFALYHEDCYRPYLRFHCKKLRDVKQAIAAHRQRGGECYVLTNDANSGINAVFMVMHPPAPFDHTLCITHFATTVAFDEAATIEAQLLITFIQLKYLHAQAGHTINRIEFICGDDLEIFRTVLTKQHFVPEVQLISHLAPLNDYHLPYYFNEKTYAQSLPLREDSFDIETATPPVKSDASIAAHIGVFPANNLESLAPSRQLTAFPMQAIATLYAPLNTQAIIRLSAQYKGNVVLYWEITPFTERQAQGAALTACAFDFTKNATILSEAILGALLYLQTEHPHLSCIILRYTYNEKLIKTLRNAGFSIAGIAAAAIRLQTGKVPEYDDIYTLDYQFYSLASTLQLLQHPGVQSLSPLRDHLLTIGEQETPAHLQEIHSTKKSSLTKQTLQFYRNLNEALRLAIYNLFKRGDKVNFLASPSIRKWHTAKESVRKIPLWQSVDKFFELCAALKTIELDLPTIETRKKRKNTEFSPLSASVQLNKRLLIFFNEYLVPSLENDRLRCVLNPPAEDDKCTSHFPVKVTYNEYNQVITKIKIPYQQDAIQAYYTFDLTTLRKLPEAKKADLGDLPRFIAGCIVNQIAKNKGHSATLFAHPGAQAFYRADPTNVPLSDVPLPDELKHLVFAMMNKSR
jgi:DNA-binding transcriptional MerR regulator